ncbi:hypothetical protein [Microbacterium sp. 13-71-7]|jgi:hypothetical protein|uniref:hypothetical protein n=1 Tax=Microbacterium sp. 13-71-7 TaxID=1970399 RepID=UPI000BD86356|nr:hypothetical protein [Microbacterium sp. 13-71-7]OZB85566.1 MAG: hypothetical protein B7X32_03005 [Microbacterium sp. 13-71-7]
MLHQLASFADKVAMSSLAASWVVAVATAAGVIVAGLALWFAYRQIALTSTQMRASAAQQAQDSEDRTRPYVSVDFVPGISGAPSFDIVVTNRGQTMARGLTLELTDGGFRALSEHDEIGPALGRLFSSGIDLAPGAKLRVLWRFPDQENAEPRGDLGAPERGSVIVRYGWMPGDARPIREYAEPARYDLREHLKLIPRAYSGEDASGSDADLRNAVNALRAIAENVGDLRR